MKQSTAAAAVVVSAAFLVLNGAALAEPGTDNPRAPNVEDQFSKLGIHGDPLGARLGAADDACMCVHYQGIARAQDSDGVPHIFLTRSGNDGNWKGLSLCLFSGCGSFKDDKKPGELVVVRFESRDRDGERLRSNLLDIDDDMGNTYAPKHLVLLAILPNICTLAGCNLWATSWSSPLTSPAPATSATTAWVIAPIQGKTKASSRS